MIPTVIRELWEGSRQTGGEERSRKLWQDRLFQGELYTFVSKHCGVNNSAVNT